MGKFPSVIATEIFRGLRAVSEYLLPIVFITTIQPMSHSVLRDVLARRLWFPLMTPANENDWQLKYDRLVLWRNATWRRTDKGIDPNARTISVKIPFLTIQLPFTVYISFLRKYDRYTVFQL